MSKVYDFAKLDADGQPTTPASRCIKVLDEIDAQLDRPCVQMSLPYCIVICLASALVWTWSIAWVPSLLHNVGNAPVLLRPPQGLPEYTVVVDCGSGKVAVHRYAVTAGDGRTLERRPRELPKAKAAMKLPELLASHAAGDARALTPLWDLVDAAMEYTAPDADREGARTVAAKNDGAVRSTRKALFFGATGGVRAALEEGSLQASDVAALEAAVKARYGGNGGKDSNDDDAGVAVHFEVLTGSREAALELEAARFAFSDAPRVFGPQGEAARVGAAGCGGKTCQIGWGEAEGAGGLMVLDADLFAAQRVATAVGLPAALEWWRGHLRDQVTAAFKKHAKGKSPTNSGPKQTSSSSSSSSSGDRLVPGPAVGVTMLASAAEQVGLAGRVVRASEVASGCEALLSHADSLAADRSSQSSGGSADGFWAAFYFDQSAKGLNPYGLDLATFSLVAVLGVARLQVVVDAAFDPAAKLFFTRVRQVPFAKPGTSASGALAPKILEEEDLPMNIEWPLGALLSFPWE